MFTGIIEELAEVVRVSASGTAAQLEIRSALPLAEIALGDSISVNGACQTVAAYKAGICTFHVLNETLRKTNLQFLAAGDLVNLETALKFGGKLGGHLVSGHVDCLGEILSIKDRSGDIALSIARPEADFPLVDKGSIAINGVSLTIAELDEKQLTVCIIPHTWKYTNLHLLKLGSKVNLEADLIGKYIQNLASPYQQKKKLNLEDLQKAGF